MRLAQLDLMDTTPLQLQGRDDETTLPGGGAEGTEIDDPKPLAIASPAPAPRQPPRCLGCNKPARVLTPGRAAVFCSRGCEKRFLGGVDRWIKSLPKEPIEGQVDLF